MLNQIGIGIQVIFLAIGLYQIILLLFGVFVTRKTPEHAPTKTFAVLVAAHNESKVIAPLVDNLLKLDYPKDMYDVFVICDNCTDNTAEIVSTNGAIACERFVPELRGKGYAIEWMLNKLWTMDRQYDAVVMFDADNLVDNHFLLEMNNDLCEGSRVIQGYLDTKNPEDSWITSSFAITYWFSARFFQIPRKHLKLANFLGGTGMCFDTALLKEMGWGATSLVEDLEFTARCVQRGVLPSYNYDAKVYDEKPLGYRASVKQRLRWMQGHFEVARRYAAPMFVQAIKEANWAKLDCALHTFNVYTYLIGFLFSAVLLIDQVSNESMFTSVYTMLPKSFAVLIGFIMVIQFPLAMWLEEVPAKMYRHLISLPIFLLSWFPLTVHAFFTQNNKEWSHTEHTRVIRVDEMHK